MLDFHARLILLRLLWQLYFFPFFLTGLKVSSDLYITMSLVGNWFFKYSQRCRWVFKSRWASSNVVGIICLLAVIGLIELPNFGWAKAHTAHLLAASLVHTAKYWQAKYQQAMYWLAKYQLAMYGLAKYYRQSTTGKVPVGKILTGKVPAGNVPYVQATDWQSTYRQSTVCKVQLANYPWAKNLRGTVPDGKCLVG